VWADGRRAARAGARYAAAARACARSAALAAALVSCVTACDVIGPAPEFVQACADVKTLVAEGTSVSQLTVDRPQEFADQLRKLGGELRTRADAIEDEKLRAAVTSLADSYQTTADLTTEKRVPSASEVRRSAARVDELCNVKQVAS